MNTKRWEWDTDDGRTLIVYSNSKPKIPGIRKAGYYDAERNVVVTKTLCNFRDPNQFVDGRTAPGK